MKKQNQLRPPGIPRSFLAWFCKDELLEAIEGDLHEVYMEDLSSMSRFKANMLYLLRVISFFKPHNFKSPNSGNYMILFRNYVLIAYRHLLRYKSYSAFNIFGLTIGLTASILMTTYVLDELSYDEQFSHHDRIYRVAQHVDMEHSDMTSAATPAPLGSTLKKEFPEIVEYASFSMYNRLTLNINGKKFTDPNSHPVSSTFLKVFDYPLLAGDPQTALNRPNSLVICQSKAMSYFGSLDILGETVEVDHHGTFTITGIMKDPYENAHFHHPILFHQNDDHFTGSAWKDNSSYTYIVLKEGVNPSQVSEKLPSFYESHLKQPVKEAFSGIGYLFLQKLTDIHLFSDLAFELEANNNFYHVAGMCLLAGFIVLVVCINYMNMATAQATRRVREVGIRKVLGSDRSMLLLQFLTESAMITLLAAVIAILLVPILLPYFNYLTGKSFSLTDFLQPKILLSYFGIMFITGILGGSYPAIFLSKFNPDQVLKKSYSFGKLKLPINKLLNAFQFAVALAMIIVTLTVYRQVEFAKSKDLGFDQENILKINLKNRTNDEYALIQELLAHPEIEQVAASKQAPGDDIQLEGFPFELPDGSFGAYKAEFNAVDRNYIPTLNIPLIAGRNIGEESPGTVAVINETLARKLGYAKPKDALEKRVKLPIGDDFYSRIVGVMKDTHMRSLHHEVTPHILINFTPITTLLLVKTRGTDMRDILTFIEDKTAEITNSSSHIVSFLDQDYWKQYQAEEKRSTILSIFSLLIVGLAFAGLVSLISFHIRFQAKEITIRKIFGAGFTNVLSIYIRQFVWQVIFSVAVAIPVTIYFINLWLENFAYRISQPFDLLIISTFVLVGGIILVITLQCRRSFYINPTEHLSED